MRELLLRQLLRMRRGWHGGERTRELLLAGETVTHQHGPARRGHRMEGVHARRAAPDHGRVEHLARHLGAVHRPVRCVHCAAECGVLRGSGEGGSQGAVQLRVQRVHLRGGHGRRWVERAEEKGGRYSGSGRGLKNAGRRALTRDLSY